MGPDPAASKLDELRDPAFPLRPSPGPWGVGAPWRSRNSWLGPICWCTTTQAARAKYHTVYIAVCDVCVLVSGPATRFSPTLECETMSRQKDHGRSTSQL